MSDLAARLLALTQATGADVKRLGRAPSYVGGRNADYKSAYSVYNWKASNTRRLKAAMGKVAAGASQQSILGIGDSFTYGANNATTFSQLQSWTVALRQALEGKGLPYGGTGIVLAGAYPDNTGIDPRWTLGNYVNMFGYVHSNALNGNVLTFKSTEPGTVVDLWYFDNSGTFTVSIDGAAAVSPARGGAFAISRYTVSGLANTIHTVTITSTSTTNASIVGACVSQAGSGLMVHNAGVFGSTAQQWATITSDLTQPQLALRTMAAAFTPTTIFIELGANDVSGGRTNAQIKADLQTLVGFYSATCDIVLLVASQPTTIVKATYEAYVSMMYDLADLLDCPLFDMHDKFGGYTIANANGLVGTDGVHLLPAAYREIGSAVANAFETSGGAANGNAFTARPPTGVSVVMQFIYTDPAVARPAVPAYVNLNWSGPAGAGGTAPTNMAPGDTWDLAS